ncbi:protein-arginine deiminase type-4 [Geospiza fortis]|uniref:protein-arginine deiminase n=1 Tax=Geospiza fortis TaxID=48883 RepID=A0A8N5EZI7_GEOFO|nr:protein-arginine deiminase type-4 [Geospiza fortis]
MDICGTASSKGDPSRGISAWKPPFPRSSRPKRDTEEVEFPREASGCWLSTPRGAVSFDVHATPAVTVHMIHSPATKPSLDARWPLDPDIEVVVTIDATSRTVDDNQVKISYYDREGRELAVAWLYLTCVEVSLDVDWSRSGRVKSKGKDKDKAKWTWGPDGQGAVLLVNCDRDSPGAGGTDSGQADIRTPADLQDMSVMLLRTEGPSAIFAEYPVVLHVPESDADKVRVFHAVRGDAYPLYKPVLGPDKLSYVLDQAGHGDSTFYVEGLAFPDRGFSGLVSFSASLLEVPHKDSPGTPIFTDTVVFRVAPWIMTPNTQQPLEVFVCRMAGRRMCRAVRDFLYAQTVQAPLEVYSEWLSVGHVDEFLTFVPALDRKGFRLLLASPNACYKLFKEKQQQGHGEATQFIGSSGARGWDVEGWDGSSGSFPQRCIDWNRDLLKQELGLSEQDRVDIPQLFILTNSRADALFPDMQPGFINPPRPPGAAPEGAMAQQRRVQLSTQRPGSAVCVLGTELALDVCGNADFGEIRAPIGNADFGEIRVPVGNADFGEIRALIRNDDFGEIRARTTPGQRRHRSHRGPAPSPLPSGEVSLDADVTRSGAVSRTLLDKASWTWGPDGHGAVLLVNCDRDDPGAEGLDNEDSAVRSYNDLQDMAQLVLRARGPRATFAGHRLLRHSVTEDNVELEMFKAVLGGSKLSYTVRPSRHQHESVFYVEGLAFPDVAFSGLVSLHVTLLESPGKGLLESPIFTDSVVFRVAPWIMTPNTAPPLEVFVCSVDKNGEFGAAVGALAERAQVPLTVCPAPQNQQDRWIQDEVEFGYIQAPHKTLPVVFDSPRDRGLKDFPVRSILGPDFGYVARQAPEGTSSLDSFGNLEVSPPVTVQGKEYPLGRILIGSSFPREGGRRMAKAVRDFLVAQKVQAPVELFSDWLSVGHVDEFLSFVPAPDRKGFRLLLASPSACYQLLREKQEEGFGEAAMFQGLDRVPKPTINAILADEELRKFNDYAQSCISWNRDILKRSLGLAEPDILDIPQLFQSNADSEAEAFFPDMVNMLVLGRHLGIPKPFGPVVGGRCCLEQRVRELLEPLGLSCTFIDDFFSYHVLLGEVHCGTNVRRKPFAFKWWHVVP